MSVFHSYTFQGNNPKEMNTLVEEKISKLNPTTETIEGVSTSCNGFAYITTLVLKEDS